jgi:non-ribosomal peptide synthetase component E (peptide arylation enzyme)
MEAAFVRPNVSQVGQLDLNLATRMSVGDLLTRSARMFGHRTAVADSQEAVTYAHLNDAAEAFGRGLLESGARR